MSGVPPESVRIVHSLKVKRREEDGGFEIGRIVSIGLPPIGRAEWLTGGTPPEGFGDKSDVFYYAVSR